MITDLQGARNEFEIDGTWHYYLTDPAFLSKTGAYGMTDLGADGMSHFVYAHRCPTCNEFYLDHWMKPPMASPTNKVTARCGSSPTHHTSYDIKKRRTDL